MKFILKLLFICLLFIGNSVNAETFKVLILPLDLFSVGENYYCFPEASEIFATDLIVELNKTNKITSPDLYSVRQKFNDNPQLKQTVLYAFSKYKQNEKIDFYALKKLSQAFDTKSIILVSSFVVQEHSRRNIWEVLEVSSAFDLINSYKLQTNVVLTDNVNNIVMWSGKYYHPLGDNENRFWAKSASAAISHLEKLKLYSKDILSPAIAQSIVLRFYPKVMKPVTVKKETHKPQATDFRPDPFVQQEINKRRLREEFDSYSENDIIYSF